MRIAVDELIEAPVSVVYRFYSQLDHLRFTSPRHRYEWCTVRGLELALGTEADLRVQQHRHGLTVRLRITRFEQEQCIESESLTWPAKGAVHSWRFRSEGATTRVEDVITWDAPWYLKPMIERYLDEQRLFCEERAKQAKEAIEAVYRARGKDAFSEGVFAEMDRLGIKQRIPLELTES